MVASEMTMMTINTTLEDRPTAETTGAMTTLRGLPGTGMATLTLTMMTTRTGQDQTGILTIGAKEAPFHSLRCDRYLSRTQMTM